MRWPRNSRASAGTRTNRPGNSQALSPARSRVDPSIGIEPKPQRPGSDERHEIALPLPGRGLAQRRDQFVVGLRPRRRTGAILAADRRQRSRYCRPPKTGPCRPCTTVRASPRHCRRSPAFGIRFDPGCRAASSVISNPNGNPSSAQRRAGVEARPPTRPARLRPASKTVSLKTCDLSKYPTLAARRSNGQA